MEERYHRRVQDCFVSRSLCSGTLTINLIQHHPEDPLADVLVIVVLHYCRGSTAVRIESRSLMAL